MAQADSQFRRVDGHLHLASDMTMESRYIEGGSVVVPIAVATSDQHHIRVISIYATRWRWTGEPDPSLPHLELGRLDEFYGLFREQLPQVIHRPANPAAAIAFAPKAGNAVQQSATACLRNSEDEGAEIDSAHSWFFVLPSDQVVAALDFNVRSKFLYAGPLSIIKLLEQCAYARLIVGTYPLEEHIAALAREAGAEEIDTDTILPPERHQIVFVEHAGGCAAGRQNDQRYSLPCRAAQPSGIHGIQETVRSQSDWPHALRRHSLRKPPLRPADLRGE